MGSEVARQMVAEIEHAYIAGQNAAHRGGAYKNPYDQREEPDLHYAFIDGYEDEQARKLNASN
jgi:hypothetical protein